MQQSRDFIDFKTDYLNSNLQELHWLFDLTARGVKKDIYKPIST